jgi:peptide methionine sulfoxide reductase MsrB
MQSAARLLNQMKNGVRRIQLNSTLSGAGISMKRLDIRCVIRTGCLYCVFDDKPAPAGGRCCINSAITDFNPGK